MIFCPLVFSLSERLTKMRASPIAASSLQFCKTTLCKVASIGQVKIGPIGQASVDNVDSGRQRRMSLIGNSLHRRKTRRLGQTVEPSCSERMSEYRSPARDSSLQARLDQGPLSVDKRSIAGRRRYRVG